MWFGERVRDVEGVVLVDIAIGMRGKVVEDVGLEGVGWLHNESVQIQPPKPLFVSRVSHRGKRNITTQHRGTFEDNFE